MKITNVRVKLALLACLTGLIFFGAFLVSGYMPEPPLRTPRLTMDGLKFMSEKAKLGDRSAEKELFNHFAWLDDSPHKYKDLARVAESTDTPSLKFLLAQGLADKYQCRTSMLAQAYKQALRRFKDPQALTFEMQDLAEKPPCPASIEKEVDSLVVIAFPAFVTVKKD